MVSPSGNTGYLNGQEMTGRNYNLGSDASYTDFFASVPVKEMLAIGYGRYGKMDVFGWYNGVIDDVCIYASPLSSGEENNLYQAGIMTHAETSQTHPRNFILYQNFPNPFNPTTTIPFDLAQRGRVTLQVYNLLGQPVRTLVDGIQGAGDLLAFGAEASYQSRVDALGRRLSDLQRRTASLTGLQDALSGLLMNLATLAVLLIAVPLVRGGSLLRSVESR